VLTGAESSWETTDVGVLTRNLASTGQISPHMVGSVGIFGTSRRTSMSGAEIDSVPATYEDVEIEHTERVWDEYPS
jgi:hypothetical protein